MNRIRFCQCVGTHNPTVTHDFILYSSTFQPVLSTTTRQKTGLGHHGFHMSLVGGIIGAKTNSHDLLARSSTCYRCRLEKANNTGSLAKIKQNMLNISVKHIHTNSQKTAIHVLVCWFFQSSWSSFMSPFTLEHSMIAGYISKTTTMHSIKQVFSNQIVDFSCLITSKPTQLHAAQLPQSESDWQIKAQYLSPVVVRRAHWGVALSPFGTSLGQLPWLLHLGLQKSPDNPCTRTASSSDSQPVFGLP